ncbi:MAG TPA: outer membrane protein transport protein [Thermoanaerobaculia bacterium]|nr:outer membrane protein transport protein [Thermoanaerobaculia bacterium]
MRRIALLAVAATFIALGAAAQNTDIESLSGLQFNFGNPGARSLGMGGAFLGLADDASAAEANPAGLTILRKPEVSIEVRNYLEQQLLTTSGTFPDIEQTAFTHYSDRVVPAFGSFVYPIKKFTFGVYFHEVLRNGGSGEVIAQRNELTGRVEKDVPNFFLPRGGTPTSKANCDQIKKDTKDPFSCVEFRVIPFLSALDVNQRTYGFAAAYQVTPKLSVGANVRYQTFRESSFTFRVTPTFDFSSISVQATADIDSSGDVKLKDETDVTFGVGFKWSPMDKISIGGVYKKGPEFVAPTFVAAPSTGFDFVKLADTTFHIPDIAGLGISVRPIPVLTVNLDAVHVTYSNLVDDFVASNEDIRALDNPYEAKDVTELHFGTEYFFASKIPFALRAGYWRDPAHAITFKGPLNTASRVAEAILFPGSESQNHWSVGAGFAWPKFQIDFAYDSSDHYKVASISAVTRF